MKGVTQKGRQKRQQHQRLLDAALPDPIEGCSAAAARHPRHGPSPPNRCDATADEQPKRVRVDVGQHVRDEAVVNCVLLIGVAAAGARRYAHEHAVRNDSMKTGEELHPLAIHRGRNLAIAHAHPVGNVLVTVVIDRIETREQQLPPGHLPIVEAQRRNAESVGRVANLRAMELQLVRLVTAVGDHQHDVRPTWAAIGAGKNLVVDLVGEGHWLKDRGARAGAGPPRSNCRSCAG